MSLQHVHVNSHFVKGRTNEIEISIDGDISEFAKDWYLTLSFEEQKKLFYPNWNAIENSRSSLDIIFREICPTDWCTKSEIEHAYLRANFPPHSGVCHRCTLDEGYPKSDAAKNLQQRCDDAGMACKKSHMEEMTEN